MQGLCERGVTRGWQDRDHLGQDDKIWTKLTQSLKWEGVRRKRCHTNHTGEPCHWKRRGVCVCVCVCVGVTCDVASAVARNRAAHNLQVTDASRTTLASDVRESCFSVSLSSVPSHLQDRLASVTCKTDARH